MNFVTLDLTQGGREGEEEGREEMENILIDFYFVEVKTRRQTMLQ